MDNNATEKKGTGSGKNIVTIVTICVAAIVIIALLATSIVILRKNDDKIKDLNNQIADLNAGDKITDDDVNAAIQNAIANLQIPEGGLTEEQVKAFIQAAIDQLTIPEAGLTEDQVKALIKAAIGEIILPESGLSEEQIKDLIKAAIEQIIRSEDLLSEDEIMDLIKEAVEDIIIPEGGLSEEQVKKLIKEAIAEIIIPDAGLTEEQIKELIKDAIGDIAFPEAGLSEEEVKALIKDAIDALEIPAAGLTEEQVKALIEAAIDALVHPESGLSEEEVAKLIAEALKDYLKDEDIAKLIADALKDYLTEEEIRDLVDEIINGGTEPDEPEDPEDPETLTLLESIAAGKDYTLSTNESLYRDATLAAAYSMTIDLNGKTLTIPNNVIFEIIGKLNIVGNGTIIVKAAISEDGEVQGIIVNKKGTLNLDDLSLTLNDAAAYGIINNGTVAINGCDFVVDSGTTGFNCLLYNAGDMNVTNSNFSEKSTVAGYAYGAPIYNTGTLEMEKVKITSSGFCTSTYGGILTIDANSKLKLTGEKFLTPDGDYFAYNAHNVDEPTSNNCTEFAYYGTAEVNQLNLDVKNAFANGGTVTLTKDGQIGSAFIAKNGKKIVINLNGYTLKLNENAYFWLSAAELTINNGTLIVDTWHDDTFACIEVSESSKLTIDDIDFIDTAAEKGILNKGTLTITNSNFSVPADNIGASLTLLENHMGVVTISGCTFGNTAPDATYKKINPIINRDGKMTLIDSVVESKTCCIYIIGYDCETIVTDCDLNYGAGSAEFSSLLVLEGEMEETVTCTENGADKAFDILYA